MKPKVCPKCFKKRKKMGKAQFENHWFDLIFSFPFNCCCNKELVITEKY